MEGKVMTVLGPVDAKELGVTSTHEHLFIDQISGWFLEPKREFERKIAREPVKMENLWWLRRNLHSSVDNMCLSDYREAVDEVMYFAREGGCSIVDCTVRGLGGKIEMLKSVSKETGLNIIAGTGYYVAPSHPPDMGHKSVEDIAREFTRDAEKGFDGTDIKPGIIGEIGVAGTDSELMHRNEEKVLRAAARAQLETGLAVSVHPPRRIGESSSRLSLKLLDVLEDEGAELNKVIVCHQDRHFQEDLRYQREIMKRGAYVEYDMWGSEFYTERYHESYPQDLERISRVKKLIGYGHIERLLFAHDVCFKMQRIRYGGNGYGHILRCVLPMMKEKGVTEEQIQTILVENPSRVLQLR